MKTCEKACATCPWRVENFNKPNPAGWQSDKKNGGYDWYSLANARRLWAGLRRGELLLCHATDPSSPEYGNSQAPKAGHERICVGNVALFKKSEQHFARLAGQHKKPWPVYQAGVGSRMTKAGFQRWIAYVLFGFPGGLAPSEPDISGIGVPWEDEVLNAKPAPLTPKL